MTGQNPYGPPKRPARVKSSQVPEPTPPTGPKRPIKVHNPVAANLADLRYRPQKTKNPNLYNRKVKHKNKSN